MASGKRAVVRVKPGTSKKAAEKRRAEFIEAFVANGGNATAAAITAGFSEKTARQQGARLLSDVAIIVKGRWPNVGRIVQVDRAWGDVDYSRVGYGVQHCWVVTPLDRLMGNIFGDQVDVGYIPDIALRPLPKQEADEQLSGCQERMKAEALK